MGIMVSGNSVKVEKLFINVLVFTESEEVVPASRTEKLYGDHYPKLQAIKKKYDPEMTFNKWYPITPA